MSECCYHSRARMLSGVVLVSGFSFEPFLPRSASCLSVVITGDTNSNHCNSIPLELPELQVPKDFSGTSNVLSLM